MMDELRKMHAALAPAIELAKKALATFEAIKQGTPGMPGTHGKPGIPGKNVTPAEVEAAVIKHLKQPENGVSPTAEAIAEEVLKSKKLFKFIQKRLKKGEDGKAPEMDSIVGMVIGEIAKQGLPIEMIKGLDGKISEIRNHVALAGAVYGKDTWARGGGDTVEAGTGITITTTVNGQKQISASGSSSSYLTATQTPNGVITVFTFAAATAQPSAIVSDNVIMRATTGAGTVNWTWNNGLKQATMTIPPQDEIFGIV